MTTGPGLLVLRADLLMAMGDPAAVSAYREALELAGESERRRLVARLARAAVMAGDLDTAEVSLEGIEPDGGPDDGEILLAQGHTAFYTSNYPKAAEVAEEARRRVLAGDKSWQVLDLVSSRAFSPTSGANGSTACGASCADPRRSRGGERRLRLPLPGRVPALRPDALRRRDRDGAGLRATALRSGALRGGLRLGAHRRGGALEG